MSVNVSARALLFDKSAEDGLVASVFRQDDSKGDVFVCDVVLPIIDYSEDYAHPIDELKGAEPGKYTLQLNLPSGDIQTTNFNIKKDTSTDLLIDLPHEGPHEWTTYHAMTGQFKRETPDSYLSDLDEEIDEGEGYAGMGVMAAPAIPPLQYSELKDNPQSGYSLTLFRTIDNEFSPIFKDFAFIRNLAELINADADMTTALSYFQNTTKLEQASLEDDRYAIFRMSHAGVLNSLDSDPELFGFGPGTPLERHYLLQSSAQGATLICLPTPWTTPTGQREVELLLKKESIHDQLDYSLTIADPMINTALGYINAGAIHQAAKLIGYKQAEKMLFEKVSYPLAASVGGYLLVLGLNRKAYRAQKDNWKNWVGNLDHWFEWMPDGAVLHSALHFVLGDLDQDEAYDALLRAYERGLPFFTFGLKLMIDGMRFFANVGKQEAKEYLPILESVAMQTDPSKPFVCVDISHKW